MEIETKVDFGQYKFRDENPIVNFFDGLSGFREIKPPLVERRFLSRLKPKRRYFILQTAELLGIENDVNRSLLEWHDKRLRSFRTTASWASWLLIFGLPIVTIFALGFTTDEKILNYIFSTFFLIFFLMILFGNRISLLIIKKYYVDTICLMNGLSIMLELSHPDGISTPNNRRRIQKRTDYLANSIIQLTQLYKSTSSEIDQHIYDHFHAMENYVREREAMAVLPKDDTLAQLRNDFAALLPFLINGNYGNFTIPAKEKQGEIKEIPYWRKLASGILGTAGIIVPVFSLYQNWVTHSLKIDPTNANTFTAIMVAWLLLTLDGLLKLGLIETFTNLVKSVRELR